MRYLGIDVHSSSIVFHLLDETGQTLEHGKITTSEQALSSLIARPGAQELLVGQEVGTMSYFVHDLLTTLGVKVLSFNAYQLRMIASSRKKSDKRLRAAGHQVKRLSRSVKRLIDLMVTEPDGLDAKLHQSLLPCQRSAPRPVPGALRFPKELDAARHRNHVRPEPLTPR